MSIRINKTVKGFSLIELMIALVVVGILVAIAYPSYESAMVKTRRASAQAHLMDIAQRQQLFLMDSRSYTSNLTDLKVTTPSDVSRYYTITVPVGTGTLPTFTATATPIAGSSQATDGTLSLDSTGAKSPADKW